MEKVDGVVTLGPQPAASKPAADCTVSSEFWQLKPEAGSPKPAAGLFSLYDKESDGSLLAMPESMVDEGKLPGNIA